MDEADLRRSQFVPHKSLPFAVERAEGAYLITPDGRRILDAAGGAIVANIGHGRREVAERILAAGLVGVDVTDRRGQRPVR